MKTFTLPTEDDDDDGAPNSITHGADYMFNGPNKLEFYYNFLTYEWATEAGVVSARAYLDDIKEVSLFSEDLNLEKLEAAAFQPIIRYLQRRYRVIKFFSSHGTYEVVYERA